MNSLHWYQKPLRMVQSVLREPDIRDYRADEVVRYLKTTGANCMIVNGGGVIDYFPNQTHLARLNQFLGEQDWLAELIDACHAADIKVIARLDFRGVEPERYEQQPDWFAQDANGDPHILWKFIRRPCYTGVYANDHAIEYLRQFMSRYAVDGIWQNCLNFGIGPCYCQSCRTLYRQETGHEIPVADDYASPVFAEYRAWKAGHADRHMQRMRSTVKSFGEDKAYCAEIFGMFHVGNAVQTGIDLYNARDYFDFLLSPAFQDGSAHPGRKYDHLNAPASTIRFLKALDPDKQAIVLYGNNGTKWRYIKAPSTETRIWLWQTLSVGGGMWNCLFNGQHPGATEDTRNARIEQPAYQYSLEHEALLRSQQPVADTAIFYSKPSRDANGHDQEELDQYGTMISGVERMLTDRHIQYSFLTDLDLTLEKLMTLKTLIMPNTTHLADEQIEIIREYVRRGGGLVATYQTSLFDEQGQRRPDFGLSDLFGASWTGMWRDTASDCYQLIQRHDHPVLADMDILNTRMIMNEDRTLLVKYNGQNPQDIVCTYIPQIYNQPPEFAWTKQLETDFPTIIAREYGQGRVVYFANQTDRSCYTNGHEDFIQTLENAVRWTAGQPMSLSTNAPESVQIALTRDALNPESYILSLVNMTGSTRRPMRQLVSVRNLDAMVRIDPKKQMAGFDWLRREHEGTVTFGAEPHQIHIHLNELDEFAAVHLRLEDHHDN